MILATKSISLATPSHIVLRLEVFTMCGEWNLMTLCTNGDCYFQRAGEDYGPDHYFKTHFPNNIHEAVLCQLPTEEFLKSGSNDDDDGGGGGLIRKYTIPSDFTCGACARLFLRVGTTRETTLSIMNYGRGDIPHHVDAGMIRAVRCLSETLEGKEISKRRFHREISGRASGRCTCL